MIRHAHKEVTQPTPLIEIIQKGRVDGLAECYRAWRKHCPPIEQTAGAIAEHLFSSEADRRLINTAARLAAEPNRNPFHGNRHFLEVFAAAALLGYRGICYQRRIITQHDFRNLLVAALVHDYGHDGGTNMVDGKHIPFRLEKHAFNETWHALTEAGADTRDLLDIEAYILATDVSKDFNNPHALSPAETALNYAKSKQKEDLHANLQRLRENHKLETALMLRDADLCAGMIAVDLSVDGGKRLAEEQGYAYDDEGQRFFLEHICHLRASSQAGRALLQDHLDTVLAHFGLEPPAHRTEPLPALHR